jgi:hypothetical protein
MNTHLARKPVKAKVSIEVQGGETLTSLTLPQTLPSHLSLTTLDSY